MSVAVARQPIMPSFARSHQRIQRSSTTPAVVAPGLIRLPQAAVQQSRSPRPRQRRQQAKLPAAAAAEARDAAVNQDNSDGPTKRTPFKNVPPKKSASPQRRAASARPFLPRKEKAAPSDSGLFDMSDSDSSSAPHDDSDSPSTPTKQRSVTAPTVPKVEPESSPFKSHRSRRAAHHARQHTTTAPLAIPHSIHNTPSTPEPMVSRSVPLSSNASGTLPDWDMPTTFSSRTPEPVVPHTYSTPSRGRGLIPFFEKLQLENDVDAQFAPLEPTGRRTTPIRPARHHRTTSVPAMNFGQFADPVDGTPVYGQDGRVIKYAGGRFQSAPAPTFLPMPSFGDH